MQIEEISTLSKKDLKDIAELLTQLRDGEVSTESIEEDIKWIQKSPMRTMIFAREEDEIIGMLVINVLVKLAKSEARVDEFVVDDSARGGGVGKKLITAAIDWAWERNCTAVELTSRPSRVAANHLYQKLGFALRKTNVYQLKK